MGKQKSERKKPNCRQENYACGFRCQPKSFKCPSEKGEEINSASDKLVEIIEKIEVANLEPEPKQQQESLPQEFKLKQPNSEGSVIFLDGKPAGGINEALYKMALGEDAAVLINDEDDKKILEPLPSIGPRKIFGLEELYVADGATHVEALAAESWRDRYALMQAAIYKPKYGKKRNFADQAILRFSSFLNRQPGYKHEDLQSQLDEGLKSGKLSDTRYNKPLAEPGQLKRILTFKNKEEAEKFIAPYRENAGGVYREPSLMASTVYDGENLELGGSGAKVVFAISAKADGTGQGKNYEKYRANASVYEGEIIFPPYSKFKIERVEEVKKGKKSYTRIYIAEVEDEVAETPELQQSQLTASSLSIKAVTSREYSEEFSKKCKTAFEYGERKLKNENETLPADLKTRIGYSHSFMANMSKKPETFKNLLIAESEYSRNNGTLEGFLGYETIEREREEFLHVELLATHPKNIDKNDENYLRGAGTSLIFEAMKIAREKGIPVVLDPITAAEEFYEKLGFEKNQNIDYDEESLPESMEDADFPTHILSLEKIEELLKKLGI